MESRRMVLALSALAVVVVLGFFALGSEDRFRREDPTSSAAAASDSLPDPAPLPAIETATIPANGAARRAVGLSSARGADAATIVGRVVDEAGVPVAEATLLAADSLARLVRAERTDVADDGVACAATDANGAFRLDLRRAGDTSVRVRAAGFAPVTVARFPVIAGEDTSLPNAIVMQRSAIATGVVLDETGVPIENASVHVRESDPRLRNVAGADSIDVGARTDRDGSFRLDQLPRDGVTLVVTHEMYADHEHTIDATAPATLPPLSIRLERGAVIEGRVVGIPRSVVDPLIVVARPRFLHTPDGHYLRRAVVEADGDFRFDGLPFASKWSLFAGFEFSADGFLEDAKERVTAMVEVDAGRRDVVLPWEASATLGFRVVDAVTREPVEALSVTLGGTWKHATIERGDVRFEDLKSDPGGDPLHLEVDALGYEGWSMTDLVPVSGRDMDLGTIELVPTPRMTITVLDDRDGTPVARALVLAAAVQPEADAAEKRPVPRGIFAPVVGAFDWNQRPRFHTSGNVEHAGVTDERGRVVFDGAAGSTLELTITKRGFAKAGVSEWVLPMGSDAERVVRLTQGGAVVVSATDALGRALAGRAIEHRAPPAVRGAAATAGPSARRAQLVTDAGGRVHLANLRVGKHSFRIGHQLRGSSSASFAAWEAHAERAAWFEVEVVADATSELVLVEAPRANLTGRVTELGLPLEHAEVSLRVALATSPSDSRFLRALSGTFGDEGVRTDRDGRFSVDGLEPGDYVLEIRHAQRLFPVETELRLEAGETRHDVALSVAILSGRVIDPRGRGVAGVTVSVEHSTADFKSVVRGALTDETGAYELRGVPTAIEFVVVAHGSAVGRQSARSAPLTVAGDEHLELDAMELDRAGSLSIRVQRSDGTSPTFVRLELWRVEAGRIIPPATRLASRGTEHVEGLAPGTWRVRATDPTDRKRAHLERDIQVVADETTLVELFLP